jgi:hypothetical protein
MQWEPGFVVCWIIGLAGAVESHSSSSGRVIPLCTLWPAWICTRPDTVFFGGKLAIFITVACPSFTRCHIFARHNDILGTLSPSLGFEMSWPVLYTDILGLKSLRPGRRKFGHPATCKRGRMLQMWLSEPIAEKKSLCTPLIRKGPKEDYKRFTFRCNGYETDRIEEKL